VTVPLDVDTLAAALAERLGPGSLAQVEKRVPMSSRTTFRVGGPADVFVSPSSVDDIAAALRFCRENGVPSTLLGNGSNVVVADRGIRGVVVALGDGFARIGPGASRDGMREVHAEAGARLSALAAYCTRQGLSGLEALSGIPGTVGGAVLMNAGAYDRCMQDVVVLTEYLDEDGAACVAEGEAHGFGYRRSAFLGGGRVVTRTTVRLAAADPRAVQDAVNDFGRRRRESQPLELPSAGSVFRRPPGRYVGRLVEECGLKGAKEGGAQVSPKHAGFIVNAGGATAEDVRRLMERVRDAVSERTGVRLEPEILFIGEW